MSVEPVQQFSRSVKLKLMETLWDQLSEPEAAYKSPTWRASALAETEGRLAAGSEQVLDWETAKRQLLKQFE